MSTTDTDDLGGAEDLDDAFDDEGFVEPEDPDTSGLWSPLVYRVARGVQAAVLLAFFVVVGFGVTGQGPFAALEDAADWVRSTWTQELGNSSPIRVPVASDAATTTNRPFSGVEVAT